MMQHLLLVPIVLPLVTGAILLLLERRHEVRVLRIASGVSLLLLLATTLALLARTSGGGIDVYLLGDWPSRIGIVLMADRLSALMVATTTLLAIPALMYASAGWDRRALHFHALFQVQLAGLNGAFLTGDIFNLFVFFEVMLIASYGLLLSGGRGLRMRIGLHYVVFNVTASTLFLVALGLLYASLGSLNMAELAQRIAEVPESHQALVKATLGLLMLVFCSKAALLPLYLWLPEAYARAPAAVAALFAIMTKVGLYALLRVQMLWFGDDAGALAGYGRDWLLWAGIATLVLGGFGVLAATRLRVLISYLVVVSAATLFVAFALGNEGVVSAGLYYLPHSTFVAAALFLIADLIRRRRGGASDRKEVVAPMPGKTVPGVLFLVAAVSITALPPLSGFLAKAALLAAVPEASTGAVWAAVLGSGFMVIMGVTRAGIRLFWRVPGAEEEVLPPPRRAPTRPAEVAAVAMLLAWGVLMTVFAGPLMQHTTATAAQLLQPGQYVEGLRATPPEIRQP